jgi:hypothetical protein
MGTKVISLKELTTNTEAVLMDCYETGQSLLVELPDQRRLTISPYDEDDDLVDRLLETNAEFRELAAKSFASGRKPFIPRTLGTNDAPPAP